MIYLSVLSPIIITTTHLIYVFKYINHTIDITLIVNNIKYDQSKIMITLFDQQSYLQFNKLSTHREVFIGFVKHISTSAIFQSFIKVRVEQILNTIHRSSYRSGIANHEFQLQLLFESLLVLFQYNLIKYSVRDFESNLFYLPNILSTPAEYVQGRRYMNRQLLSSSTKVILQSLCLPSVES